MGLAAVMPAPDQRDKALRRANEIRLNIAAIRRETTAQPNRRAAMRALADAIEQDRPDVALARVYHLLTGCQRVGPAQAAEILATIGVRNTRRRVSELTPRQRDELLAILRAG